MAETDADRSRNMYTKLTSTWRKVLVCSEGLALFATEQLLEGLPSFPDMARGSFKGRDFQGYAKSISHPLGKALPHAANVRH